MTIGFKLEKINYDNGMWGWRQLGHSVVSNQRLNAQTGRTEFHLTCSCGGKHVLDRDPHIDDYREEYDAVRDHFDLVRNQRIEALEARHSSYGNGGEILA